MRSDRELFLQTNKLARKFADFHGIDTRESFDFSEEGIHPQHTLFWEMACAAQEILTETDMSNVDLEDVRVPKVRVVRAKVVLEIEQKVPEGESVDIHYHSVHTGNAIQVLSEDIEELEEKMVPDTFKS